MARIQILSKKEREELYSPPKFSIEEKELYFKIPKDLEEEIFYYPDKRV